MKPNHETIYLVPTDYEGGQLTYTWCDHPAPGDGMDPDDAVKFVRADLAGNDVLDKRVAELSAERDELRTQLDWAKIALNERKALYKQSVDANCAQAEIIDQQRAQVQQLHKAIYRQQRKEGWHEEHPLVTLCIASPEQCLAEIKAQAVEGVIDYADDNAKNDFDWMKLIQAECDKLRQQAKGKS